MRAAYRSLRFGLLVLAGVAVSATAQAPAEIRVALVIGNSSYAAAPLSNPANDARAMSGVLETMGFTVIEARDADKAQMQTALGRVSDMLKGRNGVGLLYYAGHGMQLDWRNYMVPVDARFGSAADVPAQALDVQVVIDAFKTAGNRMNILVLDACRDNPFGRSASGKGLAQMDAPPNTVIEYATAPGNVADDGDASSGNGLYTRYLVEELKAPAARIEDVFKRVRLQVRKQSQGRQIPWGSTSLEDDFYFDPRIRAATRSETERASETANELSRESADWNRIKDSQRADDYYAFLQKYPNGLISEQAQFRLDKLQKTSVVIQNGVDGVSRLPPGVNRYAVGDELVWDRIDGYSKETSRRKQVVTLADEERVEINGGQVVLTQMGGILRDVFGTRQPAQVHVPADIALGKKWRTAYRVTNAGGESWLAFMDYKVVALEDVVVPAGTFKAYRVESRGESQPTAGGPITYLSNTAWIDPRNMTPVKNDLLFRSGGKITDYFSNVLVSAKRVPRAAGG